MCKWSINKTRGKVFQYLCHELHAYAGVILSEHYDIQTYQHKPFRKIKAVICYHQVESLFSLVWCLLCQFATKGKSMDKHDT